MCGRFFLATPAEVIAQLFGVDRVRLADLPAIPGAPSPDPASARYNIAPTQLVATVRDRASDGGRERELVPLRWGLVPWWADEPSGGARMINARCETAATNRAFKDALERRRCIVPADGFYEWKKIAPGAKQPVAIRSRDGRPLALAGLWERWRPKGVEGPYLETVTVLTCPPNSLLEEVHDRMPVILPAGGWDRWLDPGVREAGAVAELMAPIAAEALRMHPVGSWVNNVKNDDPRCAAEAEAEEPGQQSLFGG